jgi:hypothetical protein
MLLVKVLGLGLRYAAWRWLGVKAGGRGLVRALGSANENVHVIAGMLLVRAGIKSEPLLLEALRRRENLPLIIPILTDIGSRQSEAEIRRLSQDRDPQVARAAQDALRFLAARS